MSFLAQRFDNYEIFRPSRYAHRQIGEKDFMVNVEPYLDIVLTDHCNQRCTYCIADLQENKEVCNPDIFRDQIQFAIGNFNVREVLLLGGEPTVSKHLFGCIEFLRHLDLRKICITTNGWRLTQDEKFRTHLLSSGITHLNLSLMSLDPQKQRDISQSNHTISFEQIRQLFMGCLKAGVILRINNNVFRGNHDTVEAMKEFYVALAGYCHSLKFSPLLKTDTFSVVNVVSDWVRENILPDDEYELLFNLFEKKYAEYPIVRNPLTFGFVEYSMIMLPTPVIINYNHRNMMAQKAGAGFVNNLKLLTNGNLSLSWNKEHEESIVRKAEEAIHE